MTLLTSSLIPPSTAKLLSYFSNNKLHAYSQNHQQRKTDAPTYVTIVMRKDGTPTIKCTTKRYTTTQKQRKMILTNLLPRLVSNATIKTPKEIGGSKRLENLPYELISKILFNLDYKSLLALSRTSQYLYRLSHKNHNMLWQSIFRYDFDLSLTSNYYYQLYKSHHELQKRWRQGKAKTRYLTGHEDSIYCLVWLGQDKIISGSRDRSIKCWDLTTNLPPLTRTHHEGSVLCLRLSADQTYLVSGSSDSTCLIWSLTDFTPGLRLRGHTGGVLDICLLQHLIVSSSRDSTIRVWDSRSGQELRRLVGHSGPVNALCSQDNLVVSASGDASIKLWNVHSGHCLRTFQGHTRGLACIKLQGQFIYSGGQDNKLKIWDIQTGQCLSSMSGHTDLIRTIDTCNDKIVTGSYDRTIKIWDSKQYKCLLSFQCGHSSWIFNCIINDTKIVSAGQDKKIMVLDFGHGLTLT